jgi:hypothetical protein
MDVIEAIYAKPPSRSLSFGRLLYAQPYEHG